jgi:hypothetical protein
MNIDGSKSLILRKKLVPMNGAGYWMPFKFAHRLPAQYLGRQNHVQLIIGSNFDLDVGSYRPSAKASCQGIQMHLLKQEPYPGKC